MKCAVTGGSGFIGSHLVDALAAAGHEVTILDYRARPHRKDLRYKDTDIVDFSSVLNATKGCNVLYHLAAVSNVNYAFEQPLYTVQTNLTGTANILEAARHNGIQRVFFASTVWVYTGSKGELMTEESPFYMPGAGHVYTSTKIGAELLLHDYWKLYQVPFTILRYGIPYGPRMREEMVIPIFIRKALRGEPLTVAGDGKQYRNFIFIDDLIQAHLLALSENGKNETFNLEGEEEVSVLQIAETIRSILGNQVEIRFGPARPGDYKGKTVSNQKAKTVLGWKPQVSFLEGMRKSLDWFRSVP